MLLKQDRLQRLVDGTKLSKNTIAECAGISTQSLTAYLSGASQPSLDVAWKLADFLGVSMDYLVGRVDFQVTPSAYGKFFSKMADEAFTHWTRTVEDKWDIPRHYKTIYPYNLVLSIFGEVSGTDWLSRQEFLLTEDQKDGLKQALSTLSEREQKVISLRYESFMNLEEAGKEFNVTRERIRQVEAKALRQLRHPDRAKFIRHGLNGLKNIQEAKQLDREIERLTKQKLAIEEELNGLILEMVDRFQEKVRNQVKKAKSFQKDISELELSVRSYNCLKRQGIDTVNDLIQFLKSENGSLIGIRNLGRKSAAEVIDRLNDYTGQDFLAYLPE